MTATPILEQLAREFSSTSECMSSVLELIDAGLSAPYIGRVRRPETGGLSESIVRRIERRRVELDELDRRRGTILRSLEAVEGIEPAAIEEVTRCMDRFELEDLFIPYRRPEPEVQLALDRGLGPLADALVAPVRVTRPAAAPEEVAEPTPPTPEEPAASDAEETASEPTTEPEASPAPESGAPSSAPEGAAPEATAPATAVAEATEKTEPAELPAPEPTLHASADSGPVALKVELTADLARLCQPYVDPDKGVHSEEEALSGATRILSDRLGRDARVRTQLRRMLRKHGVLSARATVDEAKLGRHRAVLKLKQPLRQLQGHKLLAIRHAQKERMVTTVITLDRDKALPRVRAALGKGCDPAYGPLLDAVADRALRARLLPVIEEDVRLELKERGDEEVLRLLSQHLRQILLAPPGPRVVTAGLDVNAKGDWTIAVVDADGAATGVHGRIEKGDKNAAALGDELKALLETSHVHAVVLGHGRAARGAVETVRSAVTRAGLDAGVLVTNEVGLSSYANGEIARKELPDHTVPVRMAIGLARRFLDPLAEMLKVDPRHLRLGPEQGLVSKANLRRTFRDVVESSVAHTGCDVNRASLTPLRHIPGLSVEAAKRILAHREKQPITNREELRAEGLLSEAEWKSAIAFLRVYGGSEKLDCTNLHPDQYPLVRRLAEASGQNIEDLLGVSGSTRGLRRADFEMDEATWRDLMREIAYPGRDARPRNFIPRLLPSGSDPKELAKDAVVEGVIFNVASFGAFVDLGLEKDGMVHISEVSDRYVRDARECLAIGQSVRCRVLDVSGQRVALSLKRVGDPRGRGKTGGGGQGRGRGRPQGRGGERSGGRGDGPKFAQERQENFVRAAQTRRDGLAGAKGGGRGRGGGGGGGGRGQGGGGKRGDRGRPRDEGFDREYLKTAGDPGYSPFASFFKKGDDKPEPQATPAPEEKATSEPTPVPEVTAAPEPTPAADASAAVEPTPKPEETSPVEKTTPTEE